VTFHNPVVNVGEPGNRILGHFDVP
jgi:hypothetical protein